MNKHYILIRDKRNKLWKPELEFGCDICRFADKTIVDTVVQMTCYINRMKITLWRKETKQLFDYEIPELNPQGFVDSIKILGKPLTLQDILRMLICSAVPFTTGGHIGDEMKNGSYKTLELGYRNKHNLREGGLLLVDLSKEPKDWANETLEALWEIIK